MKWIAGVALLLFGGNLNAQQRELTLETIMADPDWIGRQPENPCWGDGSDFVYYDRKEAGSEERRRYRVSVRGGEPEAIAIEDRGRADAAGGDWNRERTMKVYSREGDLFLKDLRSGRLQQLTRTEAKETEPRFLADPERVSFYRGADVFTREISTGLEAQPAVLKFEKDPDAQETDENYLREQQRRLIGFVKEQEEKRALERGRDRKARELDPTLSPYPFYLGEDLELLAASLSPSGVHLLLLLQPKKREDGKRDRMPDYVTEEAFVTADEVRVLVGTPKPVSPSIVLLNLATRERKDVSLEALPGLEDDPLSAFRKKKEGEEEKERKPRPLRVGASGFGSGGSEGILWSDDGNALVLHVFSQDDKDRWIASVDLESGALRSLFRDSDEAWINWDLNEIGFLEGAHDLYFTSEASGYAQLYRLSLPSGEVKRLTEGDFTISDVEQSPDGEYLYFRANAEHPGIYEIHRHHLASGRTEALTRLGGLNEYRLSPDGTKLLLLHSESTKPPEIYVAEARPRASALRLTTTISDAFEAMRWTAPEVVPVPSTHHARPIYARVYTPDGRARGKRPAVVFVHGAGYLQNAHQGWSSYFREFMFHQLLRARGYTVLDMDYRASAGYGRNWRTAIYRRMGTPELEDLEDGVRWLVETRNVDPARVGVYGGSYGGFLTLMALFKEPELFACGAALRPVTDWAHYNDSYTSRILNTPDDDPEAYERSSPLEFASGLEKPLLIAHGVLDDNVFFKDSVRLVQRLIELRKESWELAIYPVEPHGFREPSSWLDEYRRIFKLFESNLTALAGN
jgi:dipeptidyl aminopeptidase/acylaminoacyl peptidase